MTLPVRLIAVLPLAEARAMVDIGWGVGRSNGLTCTVTCGFTSDEAAISTAQRVFPPATVWSIEHPRQGE